MNEYHKIQTAWLRNPEDKFKTLLENQWAMPEFSYLQTNNWRATEKVDGTNIRVIFSDALPAPVTFKGKTDAAQIPPFLLTKLQDLFPVDKFNTVFPTRDMSDFDKAITSGSRTVTLYGEGYGARIQKGGGNYIPDGVDFILFDVRIGDLWLQDEDMREIGAKLGVRCVPIIRYGSLIEIIEEVRTGFLSWLAPGVPAEGVVARPTVELQNRRGHRVITKVKHADFKTAVKVSE